QSLVSRRSLLGQTAERTDLWWIAPRQPVTDCQVVMRRRQGIPDGVVEELDRGHGFQMNGEAEAMRRSQILAYAADAMPLPHEPRWLCSRGTEAPYRLRTIHRTGSPSKISA